MRLLPLAACVAACWPAALAADPRQLVRDAADEAPAGDRSGCRSSARLLRRPWPQPRSAPACRRARGATRPTRSAQLRRRRGAHCAPAAVDEAERGFRALAQAHPELGGAHANLGLIHRQAGSIAEAVAALEKAVQASPQQPIYFNQLGITYRQQRPVRQGARGLREGASRSTPATPRRMLNLGILHDLYLRDGKRALELYDRYLALSPGGDATVTKWVADLKNRKPDQVLR